MKSFTELSGVVVFDTVEHVDSRGSFTELFREQQLLDIGVTHGFVQDNYAVSQPRGVLRGLHFQHAPYAQAKLISVIKGSLQDVIVDLRRDSETFGQAISIVLDSSKAVYIPEGFAHGYLTLEEGTEIIYKVSRYYEPSATAGLIWNDETLSVDWQIKRADLTLSEQDQQWPSFSEFINQL